MPNPYDEYEVGYIRTDRGIFIDKGNQGFNVMHPDFGMGGAKGNGIADDSIAFQDAINTAGAYGTILIPSGTYLVNNLTGSANGQRFVGLGGYVIIKKNANGPIITHSGNDLTFENIGFRGESASYTGNNVVLSGDNPKLLMCGSRDAASRALLATGMHVQIIGTNDIYHTAGALSTDYDIELGISGTATLYHHITNVYTSQATGGILLTDTGSAIIVGSQFGKLKIDVGTSPAGVNGGSIVGNRINGTTTCNQSNAQFSANAFAGNISIGAGTSGVVIDASNGIAAGVTITNAGNANNVLVKQTSSGSTQKWRFGDDSSAAYLEFLPSGNGLVGGPSFQVVNNTGAFYVESTTPGTSAGQFVATSGDNVQLKSTVSNKALQLSTTGATSVIQAVVNSVVKFIASASGLHIGTATTSPFLSSGAGTPEGAVTAPVGSVFMRTDGGAATSVYVKESGSGNTGWVGK